MRTLLVVFAILLVILTLISSLGGSVNTTERFYEEMMDEAETYANWPAEEFEEETPTAPSVAPPTGPSVPPPTGSPSTPPASTEMPPPSMSTFANGEDEEIEPFSNDKSEYMPY